jgi:enoyl-CoA hydratase/carnithine racemase
MLPDAESGRLSLRSDGGYREIVLTRAHVHNAIDRRMRDELAAVLRAFAVDDSVRGIGILGAGPSFCSGGDLREFGMGAPVANYFTRTERSLPDLFDGLSSRLVVGVHGACIGAGLELAAFASTVVCGAGARFRLPEVQMGLIPGMGGTISVPRRIGRTRTLWLLLTGEEIDAPTALEWGLVDEVVAAEQLTDRVRARAAHKEPREKAGTR